MVIIESYCSLVLGILAINQGLSTAPKDTTFLHNASFNIRGELRNFNQALVMGIVNLTPDSFFDGGMINSESDLISKVEIMLHDGVDIVDLGAYSSRPGAEHISEDEEWHRLKNSLRIVRSEFPDLIISIDTFRSEIAKKSSDLGADIINDISGGELDENMMVAMAELKLPYVLMHMKGNPQNMQKQPLDINVVDEVYKYFSRKLNQAHSLGIRDVILDPGFGFGKTLHANYLLLKSLSEFRHFNCTILTGLSRKSMVNKVIESSPENALVGSVALNTIALLNGAGILRVHDVKAAKEAIRIVSYYQKT